MTKSLKRGQDHATFNTMVASNTYQKALQLIEQNGFLLTFPQANQTTPQSIWSLLYPHTPLRWEWNDDADNRVVNLWQIREQLARSREVVYGKFYQGRATFFSKKTFTQLLALKAPWEYSFPNSISHEIVNALEMDSPLSTKQLKEITGLKGKMLEGTFQKGLRDLWENLLIVGMGEIDDGAFPSLAHAATQVVFEDLWQEAQLLDPVDAMIELTELKDFDTLERSMLRSKFWRHP